MALRSLFQKKEELRCFKTAKTLLNNYQEKNKKIPKSKKAFIMKAFTAQEDFEAVLQITN